MQLQEASAVVAFDAIDVELLTTDRCTEVAQTWLRFKTSSGPRRRSCPWTRTDVRLRHFADAIDHWRATGVLDGVSAAASPAIRGSLVRRDPLQGRPIHTGTSGARSGEPVRVERQRGPSAAKIERTVWWRIRERPGSVGAERDRAVPDAPAMQARRRAPHGLRWPAVSRISRRSHHSPLAVRTDLPGASAGGRPPGGADDGSTRRNWGRASQRRSAGLENRGRSPGRLTGAIAM